MDIELKRIGASVYDIKNPGRGGATQYNNDFGFSPYEKDLFIMKYSLLSRGLYSPTDIYRLHKLEAVHGQGFAMDILEQVEGLKSEEEIDEFQPFDDDRVVPQHLVEEYHKHLEGAEKQSIKGLGQLRAEMNAELNKHPEDQDVEKIRALSREIQKLQQEAKGPNTNVGQSEWEQARQTYKKESELSGSQFDIVKPEEFGKQMPTTREIRKEYDRDIMTEEEAKQMQQGKFKRSAEEVKQYGGTETGGIYPTYGKRMGGSRDIERAGYSGIDYEETISGKDFLDQNFLRLLTSGNRQFFAEELYEEIVNNSIHDAMIQDFAILFPIEFCLIYIFNEYAQEKNQSLGRRLVDYWLNDNKSFFVNFIKKYFTESNADYATMEQILSTKTLLLTPKYRMTSVGDTVVYGYQDAMNILEMAIQKLKPTIFQHIDNKKIQKRDMFKAMNVISEQILKDRFGYSKTYKVA